MYACGYNSKDVVFRIICNQNTIPRELSEKFTRLHHGENAKHVAASFISQLAHEHKNLIGSDTWKVYGSEQTTFQKGRMKRQHRKANKASKKDCFFLFCYRDVFNMYAPPPVG